MPVSKAKKPTRAARKPTRASRTTKKKPETVYVKSKDSDDDILIATSIITSTAGLGAILAYINPENVRRLSEWFRGMAHATVEEKEKIEDLKRELKYRRKDFEALEDALRDNPNVYVRKIKGNSIEVFDLSEHPNQEGMVGDRVIKFEGNIPEETGIALTEMLKRNTLTVVNNRAKTLVKRDVTPEMAEKMVFNVLERDFDTKRLILRLQSADGDAKKTKQLLKKVLISIQKLKSDPVYGGIIREHMAEAESTGVLAHFDRMKAGPAGNNVLTIKQEIARDSKHKPIYKNLSDQESMAFSKRLINHLKESNAVPLTDGERLAVYMHHDVEPLLAFHL